MNAPFRAEFDVDILTDPERDWAIFVRLPGNNADGKESP
jgi:hypothetical protein